MKEFIEYIVKNLVDKPDEVQVNEIHGERTVVKTANRTGNRSSLLMA